MGVDFTFNRNAAIVDTSLLGLAKYNSGPYQRAAWLLTQVRALVGDDTFWAVLRTVLADHALGSIDGPTFLRQFAGKLDAATVEALIASLPAKGGPSISLSTTPASGGTTVSFSLTDPGKTLFAPVKLTVIEANGQAQQHVLAVGTPLVVTVPDGGYLAPDEEDVHPLWSPSFGLTYDRFAAEMVPLMVSATGPALTELGSRSASHQERAFAYGELPNVGADQFTAFYEALDSPTARRRAIGVACNRAQQAITPGEGVAWQASLQPLLMNRAPELFSSTYGACAVPIARAAFDAEFASLATSTSPAAMRRLEHLISFDYGPALSLERIGALATRAPSLALRDLAVLRLTFQTNHPNYTNVMPADQPAWRAFFRLRLAETTSESRFWSVFDAMTALSDAEGLSALGPKIKRVGLGADDQAYVVCEVFRITGGDANWVAFQNGAKPWSALASAAATVIATPSSCQ